MSDPWTVINRALRASPNVCLVCHLPRPEHARPGERFCTCAAELDEILRNGYGLVEPDEIEVIQ